MAEAWSTRTLFLLRAVAFYLASDWLLGPHAVAPLLHVLARHLGLRSDHRHHLLSSGVVILFDVLVLLAGVFTVVLLLLTEGRPDRRGLVRRFGSETNLAGGLRWFPCFGAGTGLGAGLAVAIIGGLVAAALMRYEPLPGGGREVVGQQLLLVGVSLSAGLTEEFSFRGYAQYALTRAVSFWPATIVTSCWFGWAHYGEGDPLIGAVSVAEWGVFSCLALRATGNLAFSIGFHAAWNYVENALFGVSDSSFLFRGALAHTVPHGPALLTGGSVGPEGSVLFIGANTLMIVGLIAWNAAAARRGAARDQVGAGASAVRAPYSPRRRTGTAR